MANWDPKSVSDTISLISENALVLPVIQRRLVWDEDKMELLFDTLLKGNSFGGIMTIKEDADFPPLFAFRHFTKDGEAISSISREKLEKNHNLVIDGQQRLQSFYIGLTGSFNGKILYFDLFSDHKQMEYEFEFESDEAKLPKVNQDRSEDALKETMWMAAATLFTQLKEANDDDIVSEKIIRKSEIVDEQQKDHIRKNVRTFYNNVFGGKHVGLAAVEIKRALDPVANRQRVVELFRRLNDGGTRLSGFDLVASILKGFEWGMEKFLDDMLQEYSDIGITQDTLIKLIFLLRDNYSKEMSSIEKEDATFAVEKSERISKTFKAVKKFLINAKLYDYYKNEKSSFIPIYFIAYHVFHKNIPTNQLENIFDTYDTSNTDFKNIYKWIYLSLLSGVFKSRGAGWIPYKTGIRKILLAMKSCKGEAFPIEKLLNVYRAHPVSFVDQFDEADLSVLDQRFLFFVSYDMESVTRLQDIDHVHPKSLLEGIYDYQKIHRIENYQLLDVGTNRGIKNAKPLKQWICEDVDNKDLYLKKHLIPIDEELWSVENYEKFLIERRKLIKEKIKRVLSV